MRIKPVVLAFACLCLTATNVSAKVDPYVDPVMPNAVAAELDTSLPPALLFSFADGAGFPPLDRLKTNADEQGLATVAQAQTEPVVKTDMATVKTTAAVAQVHNAQAINYQFFGALMVVLAGLFMWLTLAPRR